jgi:phosphoribosylglycinamide formyltransferase-1
MPDGTTIPAFRGARAVDDALAAGVGWIGASFHRVGVEVDRGSLLARLPLKLRAGESRADLDARLHALERKVVATGIQRWSWEQN